MTASARAAGMAVVGAAACVVLGVLAMLAIARLPDWAERQFGASVRIVERVTPFPAKVCEKVDPCDAEKVAVLFNSVDSLTNQFIAGGLALLALVGWAYNNTVRDPADHHPFTRVFNGLCLGAAFLLALAAIADAIETKLVVVILIPFHLSLIEVQPVLPIEAVYRKLAVQAGMLVGGLVFALMCVPSAWRTRKHDDDARPPAGAPSP